MLSLLFGDLPIQLRELKRRQPAMLFTFLGTLSLQLGHLLKLSDIPGKALLSFLLALVQTQRYFFFYLLFPNFKALTKKWMKDFFLLRKWGSQREMRREIGWGS